MCFYHFSSISVFKIELFPVTLCKISHRNVESSDFFTIPYDLSSYVIFLHKVSQEIVQKWNNHIPIFILIKSWNAIGNQRTITAF